MLADASLGSAKQAVEQIVTEHRKAPTAKTTARRTADFSSLASNL
jgi:hypothetical protein